MDKKIKYRGQGTTSTGRLAECYRLTVARDAEEAVKSIVERVNNGFLAGTITRSEATSWLLVRCAQSLTEQDIREIRAAHFDEVAMLEALLKQAKDTGEVAPELRSLLQKQMGLPAVPKKPTKKGLQENSINDVTNVEDEGRRSSENQREAGADS